jgi:hypothetical protein
MGPIPKTSELPTAPYRPLAEWAVVVQREDGTTHRQSFISEHAAHGRRDAINEILMIARSRAHATVERMAKR